jgi:hypothetical protein
MSIHKHSTRGLVSVAFALVSVLGVAMTLGVTPASAVSPRSYTLTSNHSAAKVVLASSGCFTGPTGSHENEPYEINVGYTACYTDPTNDTCYFQMQYGNVFGVAYAKMAEISGEQCGYSSEGAPYVILAYSLNGQIEETTYNGESELNQWVQATGPVGSYLVGATFQADTASGDGFIIDASPL